MKTVLTFLIVSMTIPAWSQQKEKLHIGIEADALPYLTGGYYGSLWVGRQHIRYRVIITELTTPGFFVKEGFTNNKINAYTAVVDYFFNPSFKKWWVGGGLEYWKGSIQRDTKISTSEYDNLIATGGMGYVWKFYHNFYLNPWAAVHLRVAGDKKVAVDNQIFSPPC